MDSVAKYTVLGLDLGSNSVGWALIEYRDGQPSALTGCGVRVFDAGTEGDVESGRDSARGVERRDARQRRRQCERRGRRLENLAGLLSRNGLLPKGAMRKPAERHRLLQALDQEIDARYRNAAPPDEKTAAALDQLPYFLRSRALDHPLEPHEFGRALYHLAQRRGYLSNRKSGKKDEDKGTVELNISELRERMSAAGVRTLGEFLAQVDPVNERRLRQRWTARDMYLDEFEAIWAAQQPHHPRLLSDALKKQIAEAIFYQRPLKSQKGLIGVCDLVSQKKRAPKALLISQRFRMLQKVNDLEVIFADESHRRLTEDERHAVLQAMEKKDEITFPQIRTAAKLPKGVEFNFQRGGEKDLPGNKTATALRAVFGEQWDRFSRETQDAIVGEAMGIERAETLERRGRDAWGLDPEAAAAFGKVHLESGYMALSREAMRAILPLMEQGIQFATARDQAFEGNWARNVLDQLPGVAEACKTIRNPVVMRTLTETRRVVNAIIRTYGKPDYIRIELAREMKKSRDERKKITAEIQKRRKANDALRQKIIDTTGDPRVTGRDLLKARLWEECGGLWKECGGRCPYTGKSIPFHELFSQDSPWDIEHIIPFSRCLDDSFFNKTLCYHEENRNVKQNRTPREAYEHSGHWDDILDRVARFQGDAAREKLRRFQMSTEDLLEFEEFSARQLNDTKFASREARNYLAWLYGPEAQSRIQASRGQITSYLRSAWRLNSILGDGGEKVRGDHRHHAVDAIAIALTDRATVKALSDAAASQFRERGRSRGFEKRMTEPWAGFLEDVQRAIDGVVVSHRPSRKVAGSFHEDTNYSPPRTDREGKPYVLVRKPLKKDFKAADIQNIADPTVRDIVWQHFRDHDEDSDAAFSNSANHPRIRIKDGPRAGQAIPIHKVRLKYTRDVTPIGHGPTERHVWTRGNSHIEIFEVLGKDGNVTKWQGRVVTRLDACQRRKQGQPIVNRHWDESRRFLFSLTQRDVVEIDVETTPGGLRRELYIVRGVSMEKDGRLELMHIHDARRKADVPRSATDDEKVRIRIAPFVSSLKKRNCRKAMVTPLGEVYPAND
ncbi:MAG TPA: type II CRISPR RNA-guided endonuclease Cas9 [Candidatus Hydrogenedentes bacterium]|jgi:CRISPR-associated endonuclease Csn1|nr:type II CRISPR RNA-guided endonuclease Cas9 [Candidatus Hydrogenedentota bacterium]HPJ99169.1 type II CRISPR RNA-guided endonuclease Cas9 [Candidatus Hydrogenedentota bacterium]